MGHNRTVVKTAGQLMKPASGGAKLGNNCTGGEGSKLAHGAQSQQLKAPGHFRLQGQIGYG